MKFSRLINYNVKNTFLRNHAENEKERAVLIPFLFFKKVLHE